MSEQSMKVDPRGGGQDGFALIMAIIVIVLASLLVTVLTSLFSAHTAGNVDTATSMQAFYVAEGGLEAGIKSYRANCSGYAGETNSLGGGTFTTQVFVTDFSGSSLPAGQIRLRSTGAIGQAARIVEQIVSCSSGEALAITGQGDITTWGHGNIDCGEGITCGQNYYNKWCWYWNNNYWRWSRHNWRWRWNHHWNWDWDWDWNWKQIWNNTDHNTCPCTKENTALNQAPPVPTPLPGPPPGGCPTRYHTVYATWTAGTYYCASVYIDDYSVVAVSGPVTLFCGRFTIDGAALNDPNRGGQSSDLLVIASDDVTVTDGSRFAGAVFAPGQPVTVDYYSQFYGTIGGGAPNIAVSVNNGSWVHYDKTAGTNSPYYNDLYGNPVTYWREVVQ